MEGESGRLRCVERFCPPYIEGQPRYQMPHRSRSGVCCLLPPFLSFCSLFVYTAIALSLLSPQKLVLVRHRTQLVRRIIPKVLSCSLTYSVYCAVPLAWSCSLLLSPVFVILIVFLPACNCINFKSPPLSLLPLRARCSAGPAIRASPPFHLPVIPPPVSRSPSTSHCPHSFPFILCLSIQSNPLAPVRKNAYSPFTPPVRRLRNLMTRRAFRLLPLFSSHNPLPFLRLRWSRFLFFFSFIIITICVAFPFTCPLSRLVTAVTPFIPFVWLLCLFLC
jgi:hypothetical protein